MKFPYSVHDHHFADPLVRRCSLLTFHEEVRKERLFGFPFSSIVFNYGEMTINDDGQMIELPNVVLHPPRKDPIFYTKPADSSFLITTLCPLFYHQFTKKDMKNLSIPDRYIDVTDHFGDLHQRFKGKFDILQIGSLLIKKLAEIFEKKDTPIDSKLNNLLEKQGRVSLLERILQGSLINNKNEYFIEYIGMNYSEYNKLIRFYFFIQELRNPQTTLDDLLNAYNFFSYTGWEDDFEQFTGLNPYQFEETNYYLLRKRLQSIKEEAENEN